MGYSQKIYDSANEQLQRRRLANEQDLERRRDLLYRRSPRAEQIVQRLAHTSILAARAVIQGADARAKLEELKKQNQQLQTELNKIIATFGLPQNYLDEWYVCNQCHDTGYVNGKMCSCLKQLLRNSAYEELNRDSQLELCDFDTFSLDYYPKIPMPSQSQTDKRTTYYDYMSGVFARCRQYASNFNPKSSSLMFQGAPGLGKTHLSLAIAKAVIDKGFGVVYASAPLILMKMEKEYFSYNNCFDTQQLLLDCDLLIIDDLGTEFIGKTGKSAFYNIINLRTAQKKPIIISTNLAGKELETMYDKRIISRIIGACKPIKFCGVDIRQQKREGKNKSKTE